MVNGLHGLVGVTDRAVEPLTSYDDMSVTWIKADVAMLSCLMTWQDDISLDVSEFSTACMAHEVSIGMWRRG